MSAPNPHSDPALHDELVAYLDGELDSAACRRLEERLTVDDTARHELRQLEKVWDLLEQLPSAEVGENFTRTTVEMVAVAAAQDLRAEQRALPARRVRLGLAIASGILLAGIIGFGSVMALWTDKNNQLLKDLAVIENLELLQKADSIAFLQGLQNEGIFVGDPGTVINDPAEPPESITERRARIEKMGVTDRERLQRLFEQFQTLPRAEQDRLRQLNEQITQSPLLSQTMLLYFEWLKNLQSSERADLLAEATDKRLERIHDLKKKQDASELRRLVRDARLTETDAKALFAWLEQIAIAHQDTLLESLPEDSRKWIEKLDAANPIRKRTITAMSLARWSNDESAMPSIDTGEINKLLGELSPETRAILQRQPEAKGKLAIMREWAQKALLARFPQGRYGGGPPVPQEELMKHFESLSPNEKDKLLGLPHEEMLSKLREMYVRKFGPSRPGNRNGHWPGGPQGTRPDRPNDPNAPDRPGPGQGRRNPEDRPPGGPGGGLPGEGRPLDGNGERPQPFGLGPESRPAGDAIPGK